MALRNYVQRRNHKERSQPEHRKHLGLLEKHKDYVERARAHHIKRDKLQRLRQKAADRNQDEFYLGMIGKKTEKGVHIESRGNKALDNDVVSLLKTQDAGYLRKQLNSERKKYQALIEELAPRVPGMRLAYLEKKPDLVTALRKANLLGDVQTSSASAQQQGRVQGFGKKTKWVDDVEECT
ncbi:rRNA processing protein [Malassezia pachydermatis]